MLSASSGTACESMYQTPGITHKRKMKIKYYSLLWSSTSSYDQFCKKMITINVYIIVYLRSGKMWVVKHHWLRTAGLEYAVCSVCVCCSYSVLLSQEP